MVGEEDYFIHLLHQTRAVTGVGTALAQNANGLRKKMKKNLPENSLQDFLLEAGVAFARDDIEEAVAVLGHLIQNLPLDGSAPHMELILQACASHFEAGSPVRIEYVLLSLHTMDAAWASTSKRNSQ